MVILILLKVNEKSKRKRAARLLKTSQQVRFEVMATSLGSNERAFETFF